MENVQCFSKTEFEILLLKIQNKTDRISKKNLKTPALLREKFEVKHTQRIGKYSRYRIDSSTCRRDFSILLSMSAQTDEFEKSNVVDLELKKYTCDASDPDDDPEGFFGLSLLEKRKRE